MQTPQSPSLRTLSPNSYTDVQGCYKAFNNQPTYNFEHRDI